MAEKEMEYRVDLFNRLVISSFFLPEITNLTRIRPELVASRVVAIREHFLEKEELCSSYSELRLLALQTGIDSAIWQKVIILVTISLSWNFQASLLYDIDMSGFICSALLWHLIPIVIRICTETSEMRYLSTYCLLSPN